MQFFNYPPARIPNIYIPKFCGCLLLLLVSISSVALAANESTIQQQLKQGLAAYQSRNFTSAWSILLPLAKQGQVEAQRKIGVMYRHGLGVAKDDSKAIYWYRKAAENGHVRAQNSLGVMYRFGLGVEKNPTEAAKWIQAAANQGDAKGQENLGLMYMTGDGVKQNDKSAVYWLNKAAYKGLVKSQLTLGLMTLAGRGVTGQKADQHYLVGMQWIQRAAEQGSKQAAQAMAKAYEEGLYGIKQDSSKARYWYQRAGIKLH